MAIKDEFAENYRLIGLRIAYFRRVKKLTQEELAEKVGVDTAFIGRIEAPNMVTTMSLDTIFRIAKALDVPPYQFLKF